MGPLIEGIPEELALQCLARVPLLLQPTLQAVCRSWRAVVRSPELFETRKALGIAEAWICVCTHRPDRVWQAYDPICDRWCKLPPLPSRIEYLSNFGTVSLGGKLYVIGGGRDHIDRTTGDRSGPSATNEVWAFDPLDRVWTQMASMHIPRQGFACCSWAGRIVVAAGFTTHKRAVCSAEIYDPGKDRWEPMADLGVLPLHTTVYGLVLEGKVHVLYRNHTLADVYDVETKRWVLERCGDWPWGPMAVLNGELYRVHFDFVYKGRSLLEFHRTLNTWPICLNRTKFGLVGLGGNMYVIGGVKQPHPSSLDIQMLNDVDIGTIGKEGSFSWHRVASLPLSSGVVCGCTVLQI